MPVGNDVVDLLHPGVQPGAQHPRFDARVFSDGERRALARSSAPLRLRWTAWAAKEAAYKVMKKLDAETVWAPRRFVFHRESRTRGRVEYQGRSLVLHIDANRERIHVVAAGPSRADAAQGAFAAECGDSAQGAFVAERGDADPSEAVRRLALSAILPRLGLDAEAARIERRRRIPYLVHGGRTAAVDLSLSHHGRFVACAFRAAHAPGGPNR